MHDVCALTYMQSSSANVQRVRVEAFFSCTDARSNECCDTVVILGNEAASQVCADSLLSACFWVAIRMLLACFELASRLLVSCFSNAFSLPLICLKLA